MIVSLFALAVGFYFKYTKNMKHKKPSRTIHRYSGWVGAVLFVLTTISGFLQALVTAEEEAPVWFIITMAIILVALAGATIYVILKGRKKPPVKKLEEPVPEPIEDTIEQNSGSDMEEGIEEEEGIEPPSMEDDPLIPDEPQIEDEDFQEE
jgi:hypothetical protein